LSNEPGAGGLAIGELVQRTGVSEGTLRVWERRHGFPVPLRLASGHRRYSESDVELVASVLRDRSAGMSLAAAIARATASVPSVEGSIFAGLRRRLPELQPLALPKGVLLALSRAIEDESCAQAERPLLFGSFQRVRFYRQSQRRWRDFARTAELAVVFADFDRPRLPANGPAELPIDRAGPLTREWAVVCEAPGHAVCLAGLELPVLQPRPDAEREFEVLWSVEPAAVRAAAEVCLGLMRHASPELAERFGDDVTRLSAGPASDQQLRLASAITTRTLCALGDRR
jgi:MerR family transcriptional regulator, light-induced transcriptional regulator